MNSDETFYEAVALEIERDGPRKGLWAKAFAKASGVENTAKAYYIEWRVEQLKSEVAAGMAAQEVLAKQAARKQAEFDAEQERLREEVELNRRSAAQYPAFVNLAKRLLKSGLSQDAVEYQMEIRGLTRDMAVRAVQEARNGGRAV